MKDHASNKRPVPTLNARAFNRIITVLALDVCIYMYAYVQYFFSKTVKHLRLNHKLHVKQIWDYLCIACISCKMRVNSPSLLMYAAQIQTLSCDKCYYKNVLFLQKMQNIFFTKFGISQYLQLLCALVFACISIRCLTIIYTNMQWLIASVTEKMHHLFGINYMHVLRLAEP